MTFTMTVRCEDDEGGSWDGDDKTFDAPDVDAAETVAIEEAGFWLQRDDSGLVADRVTIELSAEDDTFNETIDVRGEDASDVTIYA